MNALATCSGSSSSQRRQQTHLPSTKYRSPFFSSSFPFSFSKHKNYLDLNCEVVKRLRELGFGRVMLSSGSFMRAPYIYIHRVNPTRSLQSAHTALCLSSGFDLFLFNHLSVLITTCVHFKNAIDTCPIRSTFSRLNNLYVL